MLVSLPYGCAEFSWFGRIHQALSPNLALLLALKRPGFRAVTFGEIGGDPKIDYIPGAGELLAATLNLSSEQVLALRLDQWCTPVLDWYLRMRIIVALLDARNI